MKLIQILLEQEQKPKVLVMAGGGGVGKSTLLNQLSIKDIPVLNPDKYVEDEGLPLATASSMVEKEVDKYVQSGKNFIWDTTASNRGKVESLIDQGYDVMMVMVYTHPIISFISNFQRPERSIPKAAVFSTWQTVYDLIDDYKKMLGDNFLLSVNLRDGKYNDLINDFNRASKKGGQGLLTFLDSLTSSDPEKYKSTFSKPYEIEDPDAFQKYKEEVKGLNFDETDESMVKQLKKYFMTTYEKKGEGPGRDRMSKKIDSINSTRDKAEERYRGVLEDISKMVNNPKFQEMLKPDSLPTIKSKVNSFFK